MGKKNIKLGAHKSTAGGYSEAVKRVNMIGGNCLQIFSTSPRGWKPANISKGDVDSFLSACRQYDVGPVYFHASYLINLAGSEQIQVKSTDSLIAELNTAHDLKVKGSVIHVGSFGKERNKEELDLSPLDEAYQTLFENIQTVLKNTPDDTLFIIENMGMRKIGRSLEEIGFILDQVNDPRLKVCLDTCHLHAAGYDLSSAKKLDEFLDVFNDLIGLDRLEVIHMNDSRDSFGSLRDRHENLGDGEVGDEVFKHLVNHPSLNNVPFILETPGYDGNGPDEKNMKKLKSFIK